MRLRQVHSGILPLEGEKVTNSQGSQKSLDGGIITISSQRHLN